MSDLREGGGGGRGGELMPVEKQIACCLGQIRMPQALIALGLSSAARRPESMKGNYPGLPWSEDDHNTILVILDLRQNVASHPFLVLNNTRTMFYLQKLYRSELHQYGSQQLLASTVFNDTVTRCLRSKGPGFNACVYFPGPLEVKFLRLDQRHLTSLDSPRYV